MKEIVFNMLAVLNVIEFNKIMLILCVNAFENKLKERYTLSSSESISIDILCLIKKKLKFYWNFQKYQDILSSMDQLFINHKDP